MACHIDFIFIFFSKGRNDGGVVLIRLDAIGDFIIWLDSAKEYRRLYPNQKITLIANAAWAEMARQLPYWDEVWPVVLREFCRNPVYRWSVLRRVRRGGFLTAIQPTFSRLLMYGDSLIRASAAKQRIGSIGDFANISPRDKMLSDRWYTQLLPATRQHLMELQRNAEFISQLANKTFNASMPRLPVLITLSADKKPEGDYFILFPGASWHGKQWPISDFANLLVSLKHQYPWQAVLCGSVGEFGLCESISSTSGQSCLNLAGKTSLVELTELIRSARLLVGNDTSAVHIAAAVKTPTVCILGGGHYGRFMPYPATFSGVKPVIAAQPMDCYYCNWRCTQPHGSRGPVPCISQISVPKVMACVQLALEQCEA